MLYIASVNIHKFDSQASCVTLPPRMLFSAHTFINWSVAVIHVDLLQLAVRLGSE